MEDSQNTMKRYKHFVEEFSTDEYKLASLDKLSERQGTDENLKSDEERFEPEGVTSDR